MAAEGQRGGRSGELPGTGKAGEASPFGKGAEPRPAARPGPGGPSWGGGQASGITARAPRQLLLRRFSSRRPHGALFTSAPVIRSAEAAH